MDMNYMIKLSKRNNLSLKADHLRQDIVKETTTIIKLRVAQGFAFCDLKENYDQLESNHERLHHNMLEMQMQHEDISGQFQKELRLRPQTLNKVNYTRSLCETLEECCTRLKGTLARCQADQAMLYRVYETSESALLDLRQKQAQNDQRYKMEITTLNDNLGLLKEEKCQIQKELLDEKRQSHEVKYELKMKAESIIQLKNQMSEVIQKLSDTIDNKDRELDKKDEVIYNMKNDMMKLINEFEARSTTIRNENIKLENELKACTEAKHALELSSKESMDHSKSLMDKIKEQSDVQLSLLEEKKQLLDNNKLLNDALNECRTNGNNKNEEISNLNDELKNVNFNNEELKKQLNDLESTVKNVTANNEHLQIANEKLSTQLCEYKQEVTVNTNIINEIKCVNAELTTKISQLEENGKVREEKVSELTKLLDSKQEELNQQADNIRTLVNEVKKIADAKSRVDTLLKERTNMYDEKLAQYKGELKDKDEKLDDNFKVILEIRADKTRLLEKISNLEETIRKIHKVTNRVSPSEKVVHVAESDNSPRVATHSTQPHKRQITQRSRDCSNKDTNLEQHQQQLEGCSSNTLDKLPVLQIFSKTSEDSQTWNTMDYQPIKRRRQQVASQKQPLYNPYSPSNIENEMTVDDKPRTIFKTKNSKKTQNRTKI